MDLLDVNRMLLEAFDQAAEEVRAEGRRDCLFELLQVKFCPIDFAVCGRLERASPDHVKIWLRRVPVADSIEKVFAA